MGNPLPGGAVVVPMPTKPPAIDQPQPARRGALGICALCNQPAVTHWDTAGRFLGCIAASDDTIFILQAVGVTADQPEGARPRRARWHSTMPPGTDIASMDLSPQRDTVARALDSFGIEGALSADICKRTGLSNSSVQQALSWMKSRQLARQTNAVNEKRRGK